MEDNFNIIGEEVEQQEQQVPQQEEPPAKKLHKLLVDKKIYSKSFDEFNTQFSTPEKVAKLHTLLKEKNIYSKTDKEFNERFFPTVKKKGGTPAYVPPVPLGIASPSNPPLKSDGWGSNPLNPASISQGSSSSPTQQRKDGSVFSSMQKTLLKGKQSIDQKKKNEVKFGDKGFNLQTNANGELPKHTISKSGIVDVNEHNRLAKKGEEHRMAYLWNKLTKGIGGIIAGSSDNAMDLMTSWLPESVIGGTKQEAMKQWRDEVTPISRDFFRKTIGSNVITQGQEDKYDNEFVTSSLGALMETAAAIVTPKGARAVALMTQAKDAALQSINSTEEGRSLPESTKSIFSYGVGMAQGLLEKYGIDKIFGKQSSAISRKIAGKVFKELVEKADAPITRELFDNALDAYTKTAKQQLLNATRRLGTAAAVEFVTGSLQEGSTVFAESLLNKGVGKEIFEPMSFGKGIGRILKSGAQEAAIGGLVLGGVSVPFSKVDNYISEKVAKAKSVDDVNILREEMNNELSRLNIQDENAVSEINKLIDDYVRVNSKIPDTVPDRKKAADKIIEREEVENKIAEKEREMEGVDVAFHPELQTEIELLKERVNEINESLVNPSVGEDAEQEGGEDIDTESELPDTYIINGKPVSQQEFDTAIDNAKNTKEALDVEYNGDDEVRIQKIIDLGGTTQAGTTTITDEAPTTTTEVTKPVQQDAGVPEQQGTKEAVSESTEPIGQGNAETTTTVLEKGNSVGVGGDVMKGVNDKMRQTKLEMEFKDGDALSFKNEDTEIVIAKPIGADGKYSVTISEKSDSNTGLTINEGKTKLFDTKLEALDYAKELKEQSLKETPKAGSVGEVKAELPAQEKVKKLRLQEQAEYDAMPNPKDEAERKRIYDKYDKLISPLLDEGEVKAEVPKPKEGKYEAKAKAIAEKIMAAKVVPDWLKIDDENISTKGSSAEDLKKVLADAVINMGKLLDKGVEFSQALRESVKGMIDIHGEGKRKEIEEGFEKYYRENEAEVPPPSEPPVDKTKESDGKDDLSEKGILNRLNKAAGVPEQSKKGFEEAGLKYKVASREEAQSVAKSVIDEFGIDQAVLFAEANKFKGGVSSAIYAESLNRLYEQEQNAKTPKEKAEIAAKFAEISLQYDETSREKGRDISYIDFFYKKSPLGVEIAENARRKKDFDEWSKNKEQSWKEVFEDMRKDPEFEEVFNEEVRERMKKERAESRKSRIEKVDKFFDDAIDKFSNGGATYSTVIPPQVITAALKGLKKAYHAGENIVEAVQQAIDYISTELNGADWDKEKFRKEWEGKLGKDSGYKESDKKRQKRIEYLQDELNRIKERKNKEPKEKKESTRYIPDDEKALLDEIEKEQSIWDEEIDMARRVSNDYKKMETERNRQLKRVGELNEKIDTLRKGKLPDTKKVEPKIDTPEIEALKAEKEMLEKEVRASIAHENKMRGLETELQRLKDRKEKEPKPDSKRIITEEERLKRDEIEAERKAWAIEKNVTKLQEELQRVKARQVKATTPKDKRELTDIEKYLTEKIKAEKEIWNKEIEPERKTREALKAAQKSLDEYERRLREKDISKNETNTNETPELKALREKRDAKRKEYEAMKKQMLKPERDAEIMRKRIEKFINKLKGLTKNQRDELIRKTANKIISDGALNYPELKEMIAEVTGRGEMTPEQSAKLKELVKDANSVDEAGKKARETRTSQSLKDYREAEKKAGKASRELSILLNSKPEILKRLTSIMQLNTLGFVALVNNATYNLVNQVGIRLPVGVVKSGIDLGINKIGKLFGKDYKRETDIFSVGVQREFFKKLGLGGREAVGQFLTGLNRMDYIQKEVNSQQIRPITAILELKEYAQGNRNLTKAQIIDKALEATVGVPAEIVARALNLGDKPMRFAADAAQSAAFAKALGLKGIDYDMFMEFPREEAYRRYKEQGLSDAEASKKADYIKETIIKEGERSTFQQDNILNDVLGKIFGGDKSGTGALAKAVAVSPYIKIPSNAYWSYFNIAHPEVAFLQGLLYAGKAAAKQKGIYKRGLFDKENTSAAKDLNEAKYWIAHGVVGMATKAVIGSLVAAGIFRSSNDEDDTKKEREGEQYYEPQGTINMDKLWAYMKGEDPSKVKGGLTIQNRWFGHWGSVGNSIAKREEDMTPEQRENQKEVLTEMFDRMSASFLPELEQGIFGNSSSLVKAMASNDWKQWGVNTINMFTNIVHPATAAQLSKAQLPYYAKVKSDNFMTELKNSMLNRSSLLRKLTNEYPPSKVGIWGDEVKKKDDVLMRMFGISKTNDDNFAQPIYEDYKRTNNTKFFPSAVKPEVSSNGQRVKLPADKALELEKYIGEQRRKLVAPYVNNMAFFENNKGEQVYYKDLKTDEEKIKRLQKIYDKGYDRGVILFLEQPENKIYQIKEKSEDQIDTERDESNYMERLGRELDEVQ